MTSYPVRPSFPFFISLAAFLLCLALNAGGHFYALAVLMPLSALALLTSWMWPSQAVLIYICALPLIGWLNIGLHLPGAPVALTLLWGVCTGSFANHAHRPLFRVPRALVFYSGWILFSGFVAIISLHAFFPDLSAVVSTAPWGEVVLKNAVGWILLAVLSNLAGVMFYLLIKNTPDTETPLWSYLLIGLSGAAVVGVVQYFGHQMWAGYEQFADRSYMQCNATFSNPNGLGVFAAMLFAPWCGAMLQWRRPLWALGGGALLFFLIFISGVRSAYIIFTVSGALLFLLMLFQTRRSAGVVLIVGFILAGAAVVYQTHYRTDSRLHAFWKRIAEPQPLVEKIEIVVGDRRQLWKAGWVVAQANPVVGVGVGMYLMKMPKYAESIGYICNDNCGNMYLHLWAEQGLIGVLAFFGVVGACVRGSIKYGLRYVSLKRYGILCSIAGLSVALMFGAHLLNFEVNLLFWLFLTLL